MLQKKRNLLSKTRLELSECPQVATDQYPLANPASTTRESEPPTKRPRIQSLDIDDEYLEQLVCGIELVFTDYAHQDDEGRAWLNKYGRMLHGDGGCEFSLLILVTNGYLNVYFCVIPDSIAYWISHLNVSSFIISMCATCLVGLTGILE